MEDSVTETIKLVGVTAAIYAGLYAGKVINYYVRVAELKNYMHLPEVRELLRNRKIATILPTPADIGYIFYKYLRSF